MIGIILAAGFSKRMGQNKLILPFKDSTIIESVIKEVLSSNLDQAYIVCREDEVKGLAGKYPIHIIVNKRAYEGQSTSIVKALEQIEARDHNDSYMFFMGDQPLIHRQFINEMIDFYYENKASILVPLYHNKRGTPVIFSSKWKDDLLKLTGDEGGRQIIRQNMKEVLAYEVDNEYLGRDIDTMDGYKEILTLVAGKNAADFV